MAWATLRKRVMEASLNSGNSENVKYQLLNWLNLSASKTTVFGASS
jgi:hypothetical protein